MYQPSILHFAELGREKVCGAVRSPWGVLVGALLAGAYIGFAMILALSIGAGFSAGVTPLVMGAAFGIGLILTIFAGAELFNGYVVYLGFGFARGGVSLGNIIPVLLLVWLGNLAGSLAITVLFVAGGGGNVFASGTDLLHSYVSHKVDATAVALLAWAVLCNWLICLAIWTSSRVQGDTAKCIILAWVLLGFVGTGFEHSVANMTALGLGLLAGDPTVTVMGVVRNLGLVTIGNVLGGLIPVVAAYLLAAQADERAGPSMHDAGPLPTALRTPSAMATAD